MKFPLIEYVFWMGGCLRMAEHRELDGFLGNGMDYVLTYGSDLPNGVRVAPGAILSVERKESTS